MAFKYSIESINDHVEKKQPGWIGFDLDGTLAQYDGWKGWDHIGEPIPVLCEKAKKLINSGMDVRILTARASKVSRERNNITFEQMEKVIQDWTEKHLGKRIPVVTEKDCYMFCFFDDSCVQVEQNTGKILGEEIPIDIGDEQDYNHPIVEFSECDISGEPKWNQHAISNTQCQDFVDGLIHGGYLVAGTPENATNDAQFTTLGTTDTNTTRFALNTRYGNVQKTGPCVFVVMDVSVASGSNRYCFKLDNLSFKSLGCWIAKKILVKRN